MIVKAQVDDSPDSLNFVFDTGSGGISLDSTTAAALKLSLKMSDKTIRGIAGMRTVYFSYNHTLRLPGLVTEHLDFHINDYDLLTSVYGIKRDGIIGYSFLRRYIVMIDYDKQLIEVFTPGTIKYPRGGYILKPDFSTLAMQHAMMGDEREINGKFIFDTGAGLCVLLSKDFVDDSVFIKKKRRYFATQAEGLGGKKQMHHAATGAVVIALIMVHVYAAIWVKGTLRAMWYGTVTRAWAKQHHRGWYRQVTGK